MAENLIIVGVSKEEKYASLLPQVKQLIGAENDLIANMANISAALNEAFNFLWVGFYLVKQNELVLGPFQGPIACTRIALGKGVCGTAWEKRETIIVDDVDRFPGHIACSSLSKSEIVLPLFDKQNNVFAVLDIDSESLNTFDKTDAYYLEEMIKLIPLA
jgi:L-methionine (R)-S-oxide reductase